MSGPYSISEIVISGTSPNQTAVFTTNTTHALAVGSQVIISGLSGYPEILKGTRTISAVSSFSFTVAAPANSTNGTYSGLQGVATLKNSTAMQQDAEHTAARRGLTPLPEPHITGMKLLGDVILGSRTFNTRESNGVVWVCTDIEGWWTIAQPDYPSVERSFGDGGYDVSGRFLPRNLALKGSILVPDPSYVLAARDQLVEAVNLVYSGAWLKTVERQPSTVGGADGLTKAAFVRLSDQPEIEVSTPRGRIDFEIPLVSADPIKYQWSSAEDGTVSSTISPKNATLTGEYTLTNSGNTSVGGVVTVNGPVVGPLTIENTTSGKTLTIAGPLTGAKNLEVVKRAYASGIVTLTTKGPHGLYVGKSVAVASVTSDFNGTFPISDIVSDTQFSYEKDFEKSSTLATYSLGSTSTISNRSVTANVATLTTSTAHGLDEGFNVLLSGFATTGAESSLNGVFLIQSVPSATTFTVNVPDLATLASGAAPATAKVTANRVTITSTTAFPFAVGDIISVSNVSPTINFSGAEVLTLSGDSKSLTYLVDRSVPIAYKSYEPNTSATEDTVTLTSWSAHSFRVGDIVYVEGCGRPINTGSSDVAITVTKATDTTFSFSIPTLTKTISTVFLKRQAAKRYRVTVVTSGNHAFKSGDAVTISASLKSGFKPPGLNNKFSIQRVNDTTFFYDVSVKSNTKADLIAYFGGEDNAFVKVRAGGKATLTSTQNLPVVSEDTGTFGGRAYSFSTVSSTPTNGSAVFSSIPERESTGTVTAGVDQLIIDTSQRSVLLNGRAEFARGKLSTTSDWIRLVPGSNSLKVIDAGDAASTSVITWKYRSGWLA